MAARLGIVKGTGPWIVAWLAILQVLLVGTAWAETRTLNLYFVHTKERASVPFKKDGRYLQEGLSRLNAFLRDWRTGDKTTIDPALLDLLWEVHQDLGGKGEIHVLSAYRTRATNDMLRTRGKDSRVAQESQHSLGKAIDFTIPGVPLKAIRDAALRKEAGGVGYYPSFIHIDTGSIRHWPRLSRKELLAAFPDGKTVHIAADGKPLPGYALARAELDGRQSNTERTIVASHDNAPALRDETPGKSFFARLLQGRQKTATNDRKSDLPAQAMAFAAMQAPRSRQPGAQRDSNVSPNLPATISIVPADRPVSVTPETDNVRLTAVVSQNPLLPKEADVPIPEPSPRESLVLGEASRPEKRLMAGQEQNDAGQVTVAAAVSIDMQNWARDRASLGRRTSVGETKTADHVRYEAAPDDLSVPSFLITSPDVVYRSAFEPAPEKLRETGRFEGRAVVFLPVVRFNLEKQPDQRKRRLVTQ